MEEEDRSRSMRMESEMQLKMRRRMDREEKRRQNKLKVKHQTDEEEMAERIAVEERKLLIAQRKLESIRLLDELLERVKVNGAVFVITSSCTWVSSIANAFGMPLTLAMRLGRCETETKYIKRSKMFCFTGDRSKVFFRFLIELSVGL